MPPINPNDPYIMCGGGWWLWSLMTHTDMWSTSGLGVSSVTLVLWPGVWESDKGCSWVMF